MRTDEELLQAWRARDEAAGRELFARYFEVLGRFFGSKTSEDVDDLVQQAFLALLEGQQRIRETSSFRAYLFSIARRTLYARYGARLRNREDPGEKTAHDLLPSPSQHAAASEETQRLLDALRRLPLDQQIALELFYWEDLTADEIADVVEAPVGTIRSRIRRARRQLARLLDDDGLDVEQVLRESGVQSPPRRD
ncbi:MAG: sigma-70 family RNA polymerase sigma factor [Myxococcales bacterium]|nr:sigma-70 family RNA polymerase sigma factor [Myxococcales bacterium]MCB9712427.1 sigma-70 family RNA polymerase sigma factor [Myxococcales bacterium]